MGMWKKAVISRVVIARSRRRAARQSAALDQMVVGDSLRIRPGSNAASPYTHEVGEPVEPEYGASKAEDVDAEGGAFRFGERRVGGRSFRADEYGASCFLGDVW